MTDIKITGHDGECADEVDIQMLTAQGKGVDGSSFYWCDFEEDGDTFYGWMAPDEHFAVKGEVVYDVCDALWIHSESDELSIQTSGAVDQKGSACALRIGNKLVANPTPVLCDLFDIKVTGHDGECADEVDIQLLTAQGKGADGSSFYWCDFEEDGDTFYGWMAPDEHFVVKGEVTYKPGEALWVHSESDELQIEYPGVTIAK